MSEIATGKLVIWMRLQAKRITPDGNRTSIMLSAAADRLESQEQTIAALTARAEKAEKERDAVIADLDALKDSGFCNSCVGCNAPHSESITYCTDWKRRGLPPEGEGK